jgi:hypothetical protein
VAIDIAVFAGISNFFVLLFGNDRQTSWQVSPYLPGIKMQFPESRESFIIEGDCFSILLSFF